MMVVINIKPRNQPYGNKNICGATIEHLRIERGIKQRELAARMQTLGVDINLSSLSKLEGQHRSATDFELRALAHIFGVSMDDLVPNIEE